MSQTKKIDMNKIDLISTEIVANVEACAQPDKFVAEAREIFGAKVGG